MYERAKSQTVPERGRHVGDGHIFVAVAVDPTPLLQSLDGSHPPRRDSKKITRRAQWRRGFCFQRGGAGRQNKVLGAQGLTVNRGRCSCVRLPSLTCVNRADGSPGRAGAAFQRPVVRLDKRARIRLAHARQQQKWDERGGGAGWGVFFVFFLYKVAERAQDINMMRC